jgi:hypothetical protein
MVSNFVFPGNDHVTCWLRPQTKPFASFLALAVDEGLPEVQLRVVLAYTHSSQVLYRSLQTFH